MAYGNNRCQPERAGYRARRTSLYRREHYRRGTFRFPWEPSFIGCFAA